MPGHPDAISHYKNACWSVQTPFRIAGAFGHRVALQKCMPERPDAISHYENACRSVQTPFRITHMHAGASGHHFALQKCMPEPPETVSHYKIVKMHAGASGRHFALQKCMPERPDAVSHYKNACRSVRTPFRITKMNVYHVLECGSQVSRAATDIVTSAGSIVFVLPGSSRALEARYL